MRTALAEPVAGGRSRPHCMMVCTQVIILVLDGGHDGIDTWYLVICYSELQGKPSGLDAGVGAVVSRRSASGQQRAIAAGSQSPQVSIDTVVRWAPPGAVAELLLGILPIRPRRCPSANRIRNVYITPFTRHPRRRAPRPGRPAPPDRRVGDLSHGVTSLTGTTAAGAAQIMSKSLNENRNVKIQTKRTKEHDMNQTKYLISGGTICCISSPLRRSATRGAPKRSRNHACRKDGIDVVECRARYSCERAPLNVRSPDVDARTLSDAHRAALGHLECLEELGHV